MQAGREGREGEPEGECGATEGATSQTSGDKYNLRTTNFHLQIGGTRKTPTSNLKLIPARFEPPPVITSRAMRPQRCREATRFSKNK